MEFANTNCLQPKFQRSNLSTQQMERRLSVTITNWHHHPRLRQYANVERKLTLYPHLVLETRPPLRDAYGRDERGRLPD